MSAHPALPPMPTGAQVLPMPKKATVTISGPDGKSVTMGQEELEQKIEKFTKEAARKGIKRPSSVNIDPVEVEKLEKLLGDETVAEMRDLDHAELRERVVTLSEHEVETEQAMANDEQLHDLKSQVREAQAPYRETIKFLKARRRLAVLLMAERGRVVSPGKRS